MTGLLVALLLGQVQMPDQPEGFQLFDPLSAVRSPAVRAKFLGPACLPSGGKDNSGVITTTRATGETVTVPNPNQTTPGLIPEDAGTVSHIYFSPNLLPYSDWPGSTGWAFGGGGATWASGGLITPSAASGFVDTGSGYAPSSAGLVYTYSVELRGASGGEQVKLFADGGWTMPQTTVTLTSGWVRYSVTASTTGTSTGFFYVLWGPTYSLPTGSPFYARNAQVTPGPTPSLPYAPNNTAAAVSLIDTKSNAWTQNGTVPQVPASWYAPPAAGPYSAANNYQGPTTLGEWTGDWSVTVVFTPTSFAALQYILGKTDGTPALGWLVQIAAGTGVVTFYLDDGAYKGAVAATAAVAGAPNVFTVGRSGGTSYARVNAGAAGSIVVGTMRSAAAQSIYLGRTTAAGNYSTTTTIHEVLLSTTPYNDAAVGALQSSILAKIGQPTLKSCANDQLAVGVQGAEVYAAGTNYALQSEDSCASGNTVNAPWTMSGTPTCAHNAAVAPDGNVEMDEWTNATNTHGAYQTATTPSSATFTGSVWMAKPSGVGPASIQFGCGAVPTLCNCTRSDGGSCTTSTVAANFCNAYVTDLGTTPVRLSLAATCPAAITNPIFELTPGQFNVSTGTTRFYGAQVEPGLYPTPYIPTVAASANRNATVSTVPLPALHTSNTYCVGITATPGGGRAWSQASQQRLFSNFVSVATNIWDLYMSAGTLNWEVWDSASASKKVAYTPAGAFTDGSTHRIVGCNAGGTLTLYVDGSPRGATSGAGTALWSATVTPNQIGAQAGAAQFNGSLRDLRIYPNSTYKSGM